MILTVMHLTPARGPASKLPCHRHLFWTRATTPSRVRCRLEECANHLNVRSVRQSSCRDIGIGTEEAPCWSAGCSYSFRPRLGCSQSGAALVLSVYNC